MLQFVQIVNLYEVIFFTFTLCPYIVTYHSSSSIYVDLIAPVVNVMYYVTISTLNKYFLSYLILYLILSYLILSYLVWVMWINMVTRGTSGRISGNI